MVQILRVLLGVLIGIAATTPRAFAQGGTDCQRPSLRLIAAQIWNQYFTLLREPSDVKDVHNRALQRGENPSTQPVDQVSKWIEFLEGTHRRAQQNDSTRIRLRELLHRRYVLNEANIKADDFQGMDPIAREQGFGDIYPTDEQRAELISRAIEGQRQSLDQWIDYFLSPETDPYPFELKVWAFNEITRYEQYSPSRRMFRRRSGSTSDAYPELNRDALDAVFRERQMQMDGFLQLQRREIEDARKTKRQPVTFRETTERFIDMYTRRIHRMSEEALSAPNPEKGRWITYPQGTDPAPMVRALCGQASGWCTNRTPTAAFYLRDGDLHVYYSPDRHGKPTIPRVTIRMNGTSIAEVRGVGVLQSPDAVIAATDVIPTRLREFGIEGERFRRRSQHMDRVATIERRSKNNETLTREELRFLYEVDEPIEGFAPYADPRIAEIVRRRGRIREDLAEALGIDPSRISTTREEALSGRSEFHYGDLDLSDLIAPPPHPLPRRMVGSLNLGKLRNARGLTLPEVLIGDLNLYSLTRAQGLTLPHYLGGELNLSYLTSAPNLTLPRTIRGQVHLTALSNLRGLTWSDEIRDMIHLSDRAPLEQVPAPFRQQIEFISP